MGSSMPKTSELASSLQITATKLAQGPLFKFFRADTIFWTTKYAAEILRRRRDRELTEHEVSKPKLCFFVKVLSFKTLM